MSVAFTPRPGPLGPGARAPLYNDSLEYTPIKRSHLPRILGPLDGITRMAWGKPYLRHAPWWFLCDLTAGPGMGEHGLPSGCIDIIEHWLRVGFPVRAALLEYGRERAQALYALCQERWGDAENPVIQCYEGLCQDHIAAVVADQRSLLRAASCTAADLFGLGYLDVCGEIPPALLAGLTQLGCFRRVDWLLHFAANGAKRYRRYAEHHAPDNVRAPFLEQLLALRKWKANWLIRRPFEKNQQFTFVLGTNLSAQHIKPYKAIGMYPLFSPEGWAIACALFYCKDEPIRVEQRPAQLFLPWKS